MAAITHPRYSIVRSFLRGIHAQHYPLATSRQVLQFDADAMSIVPWFWPVYDKEDQAVITDRSLVNTRVRPADLEEYRRCHDFLAPCCLCAFIDDVAYTESHIGVVGASGTGSADSGHYMAECARKRCGYSEDFFPLFGLRVKRYPLRDDQGDGIVQVLIPLKGSKKRMTQGDPNLAITLSGNVQKLGKGGLPEAEFWNTFVQCFCCKWIMVKSQFPEHHQCSRRSHLVRDAVPVGVPVTEGAQEVDFIDLTGDEQEVLDLDDGGRFIDLTMD
ncbi:hypothetical protein BKA70DRAFT_1239155 [Coprinopsis sp. MPI-PUGE-AT-0042]|nr:hypothetical protein BKA70DRAFT_1239155 [Coprinopsis sp. MPI-PUGE-AT-0042]